MNRIITTILLIGSIGCGSLERVLAEAPKPKGGCWSRDIVMRPTADPVAMMTIKGRVIAIEYNNKNQQIAAKELVTWVRIKTANGSTQSIYLGLNQYLKQKQLQLQIGDVLEVQGLQTIKQHRPVIATRVGCFQNYVIDGETGWLVPADDFLSLAEALKEVIDNPEKTKLMGEAAHRNFMANYTQEIIGDKLLIAFEK
jgi:hypothetical protein